MPRVSEAKLEKINKKLTSSIDEFNSLVRRAVKQVLPEMLIEFQIQLVLEILTRVVNKTPVDTGRARGNWQVAVGKRPEGKLDTTDKGGSSTIDTGMAKLAGLGFGEVVWISNNLDYIIFLEAGSSTQAPQGMVALSLAEVRTIFR